MKQDCSLKKQKCYKQEICHSIMQIPIIFLKKCLYGLVPTWKLNSFAPGLCGVTWVYTRLVVGML